MAYLKRGLDDDRQQTIRNHLATCDACARSLRETKTLETQLYAQAARHRPMLSPQASARVQERVYRRMRRAIIMQRITQFAGAGIALALLALIVGFMFFRQDSSGAQSAQGLRITVVSPTKEQIDVTPTPKPTTENTPVTIVFNAETGGDFEGSFTTLGARFHDTHPNITVAWDDLFHLVVDGMRPSAARIAQEADCFIRYPWSVDDPDLPHLLPLDTLLEADGDFPLDDFYPVTLDKREDGQIWGLPLAIYPQVMYYKKRLFDQAGLAYPSPDWTIDDFAELALALTTGEGANKKYGYYPRPFGADNLFFVEQYGAQLIDHSTQPPTVLLDDPLTVEAVRWYTDLYLTHGVMPEPDPAEADSIEDWQAIRNRWTMALQSGKAAMWSDFSEGDFPTPWEGGEPRLRIVPMPRGEGQVTDFMSDVFYISAQSKHPQACLEWFEYLSEQQAYFFAIDDTPGVPSRRSMAESEVYNEQMGEEAASILRATIKDNPRASLSSRAGAVNRIYLSMFEQAFLDIYAGTDIEPALNTAQLRSETYHFCQETIQSPDGLLDCLQQADPEFPWAESLEN